MAEDRKMVEILVRDFNEMAKLQAAMNVEVKQLLEHARDEKRSAGEYRRDLRQEVHALRMEQAQHNLHMVGIRADVEEVKADVAKLETKIDTHEKDRLLAIGGGKVALYIVRALYVMLGGVAVWLVTQVVNNWPPRIK